LSSNVSVSESGVARSASDVVTSPASVDDDADTAATNGDSSGHGRASTGPASRRQLDVRRQRPTPTLVDHQLSTSAVDATDCAEPEVGGRPEVGGKPELDDRRQCHTATIVDHQHSASAVDATDCAKPEVGGRPEVDGKPEVDDEADEVCSTTSGSYNADDLCDDIDQLFFAHDRVHKISTRLPTDALNLSNYIENV